MLILDSGYYDLDFSTSGSRKISYTPIADFISHLSESRFGWHLLHFIALIRSCSFLISSSANSVIGFRSGISGEGIHISRLIEIILSGL